MPRSLLAVLPLLLVVLLAGPAAAHTTLVSSSPAATSTVASPGEVVLRFDDPVQPDLSTVTVLGADGTDRASGAPELRGGTEVVQALDGPLEAGAWTVSYRVVAQDGHPVVGSYVFTATAPEPDAAASAPVVVPETPAVVPETPAATPPPRAAPVAAEEPDAGGTRTLVLVAGGLLLAALAGGAVARRGRR